MIQNLLAQVQEFTLIRLVLVKDCDKIVFAFTGRYCCARAISEDGRQQVEGSLRIPVIFELIYTKQGKIKIVAQYLYDLLRVLFIVIIAPKKHLKHNQCHDMILCRVK